MKILFNVSVLMAILTGELYCMEFFLRTSGDARKLIFEYVTWIDSQTPYNVKKLRMRSAHSISETSIPNDSVYTNNKNGLLHIIRRNHMLQRISKNFTRIFWNYLKESFTLQEKDEFIYILLRLWNQGQFHEQYFVASPMPPIADMAVNLHGGLHPILYHSISTRHPNFNFVRIIIDAENNEDALNHLTYGLASLHLAVLYDHAKIVRLLLAHPNIQVNLGTTRGSALYWAVFHNKVEIIKLLLAHPDLKINATDNSGETALFAAVNTSWKDTILFFYLVNLLVTAGADSSITNEKGETVLEVAKRNHFSLDKLEVLNQICSEKQHGKLL